jgi:hypothetical protein
MHRDVSQMLKSFITRCEEDAQSAKEQLDVFKKINVGSIILVSRSFHIHTVRDGVGSWTGSFKPALLRYTDWGYHDMGFELRFDVVASDDPVPYNFPFDPIYSGFKAQIVCPKFSRASEIKIVPVEDLPLYVGLAYMTPLFKELLK